MFTILAFNTLGDGIRDALGLGLPKGKQRIKGRLGLTTVTRPADQAPPPRERPAALGHRPVGGVPHRSGAGDGGRPRELRRRRRRGRRAGRRIGLGQDGVVARGDAAGGVAAGPHHRAARCMFDGRDLLSLSFKEMRDAARRPDRDGVPGPDDEPQPRVHHRDATRRHDPAAPHDEQVGGARDVRWSCSSSSASPTPSGDSATTRTSCRAACASARMLALSLSCDPRAAHRRRAHHRARRDRAGADPRPAALAAGAPRHGGALRHPRPRRRRRPVLARRS